MDDAAREQAKRTSLLRTIRAAALVVFLTVVLLSVLSVEQGSPGATPVGGLALKIGWHLVFIVAGAIALVVVAIETLTSERRISTLVTICVGLLLSLLTTWALGSVLDLLHETYNVNNPTMLFTAKVLLGIALAYLFISTIVRTQDDFRLVIPYVEFAKQMRGVRPLVLDTSALVDARIVDVAATGLIQSVFIVPQFVVAELQTLADSQDKLKRAKGRRGLDVLAKLQRLPGAEVRIDSAAVTPMAVDQMLVEFAQRMNARLVTTDLGLTRVAQIQGASVLNLHEAAAAFRPSLIPGEALVLRIVKAGEQPGQGVGYLEDGTMVVVEDAASIIGHDAGVLVTSSLQTSAGRLVFAKLADRPEHADVADAHAGATTAQPGAPSTIEPERPAPIDEPAAALPSEPTRPSPEPPGPTRPFIRRAGSPRNPRR